MPRITVDRSFKDREELDTFVRNTFGADIEKNRDITLEADQETLTKLSLSESTTVHGVKVVAKSEEVVKDVNVDPANQINPIE